MVAALGWVGICVLVVVPVLAVRRLGARWRWFAWGILSWVIGLILKGVFELRWDDAGGASLPWGVQAAALGVVSAVAELGAAACFFWRARLRLPDVLAFGVGIGAFEAVFLLVAGSLEEQNVPGAPAAKRFAFVGAFFLLERLLTMIGHIASRVLLYVGLREKWSLPLLVSVALFSLVDGTVIYGAMANWDWSDAGLLTRFYLFLAATGGFEVAAAWWFGRKAFGRAQTAEAR
jgi:hypothetical protein